MNGHDGFTKYDAVVKDLFEKDHPSLLDQLTGGLRSAQTAEMLPNQKRPVFWWRRHAARSRERSLLRVADKPAKWIVSG